MRYILFVIPDLKQKNKELKLDSENYYHKRVTASLMALRSASKLRICNCPAIPPKAQTLRLLLQFAVHLEQFSEGLRCILFVLYYTT